MPTWMLLDYGQVLSTAPPEDEWNRLRQAAGPAGDDPDAFLSLYWEHRPEYDRADLTVEGYWTRVLGLPPAESRLQDLIRWDVAMWLHPDQPTVDAAHRAAERGWRLALFSNAPVEVAAGIDGLEWLAPFERRFFSCALRSVKPEPAAYRHVMEELAAQPGDILFLDDRPPNVEAARALGIEAEVFTHPGQIEAATLEGTP